jgi:hypothetical protein
MSIRQRLHRNVIHIIPFTPISPKDGSEKTHEDAAEDPWLAISVNELQRAFRNFSKESGRLSRMAQRKKKVCIPSDGFNQLLAQRLEDVERAFHLYLRRKEELLTYIEATGRRSDVASEESNNRRLRPRAS